MKHETCPTCKSSEIEVFWETKDAPVFSMVTMKTREASLNVLRKKIKLTFCKNCGLIFNSSFNTSVDFINQDYEDQQGFSQTFINSITAITKAFIEKYNLYNKKVVEIGCGKGDFINLISDLGNNRGVGIDPACVPGRGKKNENVQLIKEYYGEKHAKLDADCICCRHTLEHIQATGDFIQLVRKTIHKKDTVLFFEVPNVMRILEKKAFWDIYYEHCTYLSPGSLARLFRLNKFEVEDLYLANDDQYLFIEAKPTEAISDKIHPAEESIQNLKMLIDDYKKSVTAQMVFWMEKLKNFKATNQKVVLWGGGSRCVAFLTQFADMDVIKHVVDINPFFEGNFVPGFGIQYHPPTFLKTFKPDKVIIMNGIYKKEIAHELSNLDLKPELLCL